MKIVTTYVSYDGFTFEDYNECFDHENYARDMLMQVMECCTFYTESTEIIYPYFHNLDEMIQWVEIRWKYIERIHVKKEIPSSAYSWWMNYFGYWIPEEEGMWEYNHRTMEWEQSE